MAKSSPLERTSVQLMIGAALLALLANSAVDQTDDKLPWEVTLTGFCLFAVVFAAIYAKRTEVAVSIVTIVGMIVPTYFVHYMEVPCSNWLLGSQFPLAAPPKEVLAGIFAAAPNASRYDGLLPFGLSAYHLSLFNPSMAVTADTSELYHPGPTLDDAFDDETREESSDSDADDAFDDENDVLPEASPPGASPRVKLHVSLEDLKGRYGGTARDESRERYRASPLAEANGNETGFDASR